MLLPHEHNIVVVYIARYLTSESFKCCHIYCITYEWKGTHVLRYLHHGIHRAYFNLHTIFYVELIQHLLRYYGLRTIPYTDKTRIVPGVQRNTLLV